MFFAAHSFDLLKNLLSWDLTSDLIVGTIHVHIDQFQALCQNDHMPNFLSFVTFVNEAQ